MMPTNYDRLINRAQGDLIINALQGIERAMSNNFPLEDVNVIYSDSPQTILPSQGYYGINSVNVPAVSLGTLNVNENGEYNAESLGYTGFSVVNVDVQGGGGEPISVLADGSRFFLSFNQPVVIDNASTNCSSLFLEMQSFNCPVNIPNNVIDCSAMFMQCYSFNLPVVIPDNVVNCSQMFMQCNVFNQLITLPNNTVNCSYMFASDIIFNQPITIPNKVNNCGGMFKSCHNFNQPVNIPDSVTNCGWMFTNCYNFNSPVTIGNNAVNCSYMFENCNNFNQSVTIPRSVVNCSNMFALCKNMSGNIYIANSSLNSNNVRGLLRGTGGAHRRNVFCNNIGVLSGTSSSNSLIGATILWTSTTNGYYNSTYNIYIYNNYPA